MKRVKTARCPSLSIDAFWLPNAWMLKFDTNKKQRILTSKQRQHSRLQSNRAPRWSSIPRICLHSVVCWAAEVPGAEAE